MGERDGAGPNRRLDSFDKKILQILVVDGRISWRQLADHINLSHTPTLRRVHRLEQEEYITGYIAVVNEKKMFGSTSILLVVGIEDRCAEKFESQVLEIPQVIYCSRYTGSSEYMLNIYSETIEESYALIELISGLDGVFGVTSHPLIKIVRRPDPVPKW